MTTSAPSDIFDACRKGDLESVKMMYESDPAIIDAEDHKGFTPCCFKRTLRKLRYPVHFVKLNQG